MDYKQFREIWESLFAVFETIDKVNPPDLGVGIDSHWKCHNNFTESKIYGEDGKIIGSETCYFILPCNQNGAPLHPPIILLREWRDIRQYLHPTLQ